MAEQRTPTAEEIRTLVRTIVDATLDGGPGAAAPTGPDPGTAGTASSEAIAYAAAAPALDPAAGGATASPTSVGAKRDAIAIGADHGGFALKERIGRVLAEQGYEVRDCGTHGPEAVDYPDFAHVVARLVADGACRSGIIVDGAGIGSAMVANKVPGVRAANCHDLSSARNSREHNHANVLTLGAGFLGERIALDIVQAWLGTEWGPGRHAARVDKITDVERRYARPPGEGRAG